MFSRSACFVVTAAEGFESWMHTRVARLAPELAGESFVFLAPHVMSERSLGELLTKSGARLELHESKLELHELPGRHHTRARC